MILSKSKTFILTQPLFLGKINNIEVSFVVPSNSNFGTINIFPSGKVLVNSQIKLINGTAIDLQQNSGNNIKLKLYLSSGPDSTYTLDTYAGYYTTSSPKFSTFLSFHNTGTFISTEIKNNFEDIVFIELSL